MQKIDITGVFKENKLDKKVVVAKFATAQKNKTINLRII